MSLITDKFFIRTACRDDASVLLVCALTGFLKACPHAQALKITPDQAREFMRWIVQRSLHTPYSVMIFEKSTGNLVGFRLYSVSHRDGSQDFEPFELDVDSMTGNVRILCKILDNLKDKIWDLFPNVEKVLRQEVTFVDPRYQRQGIASYLINLLNVELLKIRDEYIWPDGSPIIFPDETKSAQLFFLPFHCNSDNAAKKRKLFKRLENAVTVFE